MSLAILCPNGHYLMNVAILKREHIIFLVLPFKYLFTPNKEIEQKLLSHSCMSIGWLVWYKITDSFRSWEVFALLISLYEVHT